MKEKKNIKPITIVFPCEISIDTIKLIIASISICDNLFYIQSTFLDLRSESHIELFEPTWVEGIIFGIE